MCVCMCTSIRVGRINTESKEGRIKVEALR